MVSTKMKEMVGGCCVCSDERGWPENPLVYCDGVSCTVAVHQACYGIVAVPTGPWYCRKCECEETSARCMLCPWKDGALKRTDDREAWAHVVCALYIPEIRFGNVSTMEPIILRLVPPERYSKSCYICQEKGKGSKANFGACMQCNKTGCKQQFHVTCAQTLGLLCEEAGNYLDNVKYCGYCQYHYSKLKKNGNVKTIPPYRPIGRADLSDPSSSPELQPSAEPSEILPATVPTSTSSATTSASASDAPPKTSSQNGPGKSTQRKSSSASNSSASISSSSAGQPTAPHSSKQSAALSQSANPNQTPNLNTSSSSSNLSADQLNASGADAGSTVTNTNTVAGIAPTATPKESSGSSGKSSSKSSSNRSSSSSSKSSSKEPRESKHSKVSRHHSKDSPATGDYDHSSAASSNANSSNSSNVFGQKFTTSNFTEIPTDSLFGSGKSPANQPVVKKRKVDSSKSSGLSIDESIRDGLKDISVTLTPLSFEKGDIHISDIKKKSSESDIIQSVHAANLNSSIIKQNEDITHRSAIGVGAALPLTPATITAVGAPLNPGTSSANLNQIATIKSLANPEALPITHPNRSHVYPNIVIQQPADLHAKDSLYLGDKPPMSGAIVRNPSPSPSIASTSMDSSSLKITIKAPPNTDDISMSRITSTPDDNSNPFSDLKITYEAQPNAYDNGTITPRGDIKASPPSSPNSGPMDANKSNHGPSGGDAARGYPAKELVPTHMLGNQLNPASSVAQKMSDQLFMEMEAQSAYGTANLDAGAQLIGPIFPGKQARSAPVQPQGPSLASMLSGNGTATAHGNTPQSLEQLLERQWEQGSQFLMEQAQHFDIASLLTCLHQLRSENIRLEEHVNNLVARRDHLLAVNARLTIPLNQSSQSQNPNPAFNSLHLNGTSEPSSRSRSQHLK